MPCILSRHGRLLSNEVSVSDLHLLTAALGLNGDIASQLCEIRKGSCNHQIDWYHLTDIVCKAVDDNCLNYDPNTEVIDILVASGISSPRASILAEKLQKDELSLLQLLTYWIEWHLDSMFKYNIFFHTEYRRFPYNEKELKKWFESPVTRTLFNKSTDKVDESFFSMQVYNTVHGLEGIKRDGVCYPPKEETEGV